MNNGTSPVISVVVPCYNEEQAILACHQRLSAVLQPMGLPYEIIYVDDGSKDHTADVVRRLQPQDPSIHLLSLSRNFGHQVAVTAGLDAVRGAATIIIDADLQDPPELIPEMLQMWRSGFQVVYGIRDHRDGESGFKRLTAKIFYRLINALSEHDIPLDAGDFRLIDHAVVQAFRNMPERHRLLRAMSSYIGYRQVGLFYHRAQRFAGKTKYPLSKMMTLAIDGIISFSVVPLRMVTFLGFLTALLSFIGILYSLAVRLLTHSWVAGWAISFIGMLFMSGAEMLCIGILGEYIGRIYTESKQRPLYFLRTEAHLRSEAHLHTEAHLAAPPPQIPPIVP